MVYREAACVAYQADRQGALIFRVAMPAAIDLASLFSLSIMIIKSLKRYLAEMAQDVVLVLLVGICLQKGGAKWLCRNKLKPF